MPLIKPREAVYKGNNDGNLEDVALVQDITLASRAAVGALVRESTNSEGRVEEVNPLQGVFDFFSGGSAYKWPGSGLEPFLAIFLGWSELLVDS